MKAAVCQINSIIGDIEGNKKKILEYYLKGVSDGVDIVVTPELSLTGYTPLDLVEKEEFRQAVYSAASDLASSTNSTTALLFGSISEFQDNIGTNLFNSALFCINGKIDKVIHKTLIPNYDVFDEVRYFESAKETFLVDFKGEKLGISICEDIWNDEDYWKKRLYPNDPVKQQIDMGATFLINISASPYSYGKRKNRFKMLTALTKEDGIPLIYTCCVGAQTELIFDGVSFCFNADSSLAKKGAAFKEDYFVFDSGIGIKENGSIELSFPEEIHDALILGISDYTKKTGFKKALIGLSGGVDSALITYLAVKALGNENVHTVLMPSEFSSEGSIVDSIKLAKNLGVSYETVPITPVFNTIKESLSNSFGDEDPGLAEENIQSRIRGLFLMALSNKFGYLLLTTGNKSELATGYATLYGDMAGALAPIGDVYKTGVYQICEYINRNGEIIPEEILTKAPSAELRPNQTDQDSLPPYNFLDEVLKLYLEENKELKEIALLLGNFNTVKEILNLVDKNEFKRRQAAPVLRISNKAFGYGRRFPVVQKWRRK
ncbi:MAG: NAD+ synthase [Ignavibacteriaceae bacterium]|nr:NAD+ synthase [Ignavibacteriaceae bacterium]